MTNPYISAVALGAKVALIFESETDMNSYAEDYINSAYRPKRLGPAAREYQIGTGRLQMFHTNVVSDYDLSTHTIVRINKSRR